jgi:hypothetical protein
MALAGSFRLSVDLRDWRGYLCRGLTSAEPQGRVIVIDFCSNRYDSVDMQIMCWLYDKPLNAGEDWPDRFDKLMLPSPRIQDAYFPTHMPWLLVGLLWFCTLGTMLWWL